MVRSLTVLSTILNGPLFLVNLFILTDCTLSDIQCQAGVIIIFKRYLGVLFTPVNSFLSELRALLLGQHRRSKSRVLPGTFGST